MALTVHLDNPDVGETLIADRVLECDEAKTRLIVPGSESGYLVAAPGQQIDREWAKLLDLTKDADGKIVQRSVEPVPSPSDEPAEELDVSDAEPEAKSLKTGEDKALKGSADKAAKGKRAAK